MCTSKYAKINLILNVLSTHTQQTKEHKKIIGGDKYAVQQACAHVQTHPDIYVKHAHLFCISILTQ